MTETPEGGVIHSPKWPDGCPMTLNELPMGDVVPGHVDCRLRENTEGGADRG